MEDPETGPSVSWAKQQAVRLNAFVQVGYPEKRITKGDNGESIEKYYNSVCFVSPEGKVLVTYAKHFLYYTDENWAEEGPEFVSIPTKSIGQVGFGICMDLNPYQFKTTFSDFEFGNFHFKNKSDLILCSMAWNKDEEGPKKGDPEHNQKPIKSGTDKLDGQQVDDKVDDDDEDWEDEEDEDRVAALHQYETIQYWALRMSPFYSQTKSPFRKSIIVIANRTGKEANNLFVGSSCVLRLESTGPVVIGALPANKEGVLKVEI
ncbi:Carbon-nitrogen hydrolase [Entomortierella beljakovae]|nr:Carbon-nitrogen hydrolase [Entomortierella beljakovae]